MPTSPARTVPAARLPHARRRRGGGALSRTDPPRVRPLSWSTRFGAGRARLRRRRIDLSLATVDLQAAIDDSTKRAAIDVLSAADRGADVDAASLDDLGPADRCEAGSAAGIDDLDAAAVRADGHAAHQHDLAAVAEEGGARDAARLDDLHPA